MVLSVLLVLACALFVQAFAMADDGAVVYKKCSGCHKATGAGTPGFFPPLAGHAVKLVNAGRTYPIQATLFGLKGEIRVEGKTYDGTMPAYGELLNDGEIAAVLNYIFSSWGNDKSLPIGFGNITPAEVKAQRAGKMTPEQVQLTRKKLKMD